jgi:hypothetical protein
MRMRIKSRSGFLLSLAIVIVGSGFAVFQLHKNVEKGTPIFGNPSPAITRVSTPSKRDDPAAKVALPPRHLPRLANTGFVVPKDAPPDEIISASKEAASQGDPVAMAAMAEALRDCALADTGGDDAIADRLVRQVAGQQRMGELLNVKVVGTSDPAVILSQRLATRNSCNKVSTADAKAWTGWMERAAQAGDHDGAIQYARSALLEFSDPATRVENVDEYERRKSNAFDFLSDELSGGNCGYEVINGLQTMSPDPGSKYVYGSVMLQMSAAQGGNGAKSPSEIAAEDLGRQQLQKILEAQVPPDQLASGASTARYIYQNYCGG